MYHIARLREENRTTIFAAKSNMQLIGILVNYVQSKEWPDSWPGLTKMHDCENFTDLTDGEVLNFYFDQHPTDKIEYIPENIAMAVVGVIGTKSDRKPGFFEIITDNQSVYNDTDILIQYNTSDIELFAKRVERMQYPQWTDEEFEIWWNDDPLFTKKINEWGYFNGTQKEKAIWLAKSGFGIQ